MEALDPSRVIALGGAAAISDAVLEAAADGRNVDRVAGATRFETAAAISQNVFPTAADVVYLARADIAPDAVVAGSLTGGPILLADRCGPLHPATTAELQRLHPDKVVALGGPAALCDEALARANDAARSRG